MNLSVSRQCGTLSCSRQRPFSSATARRAPLLRRPATESPSETPTTSSSEKPQPPSDEARIEQIEAMRKQRRAAPPAEPAPRPIPIRGMTTPQKPVSTRWPEGQLLPNGWEEMSLPEKVNQLYMGERGMLFWANKVAYAACFALVGGWVIFRFVGPALGLYELSTSGGLPTL